MSHNLTVCPMCHAVVAPLPDGTCPNCRGVYQQQYEYVDPVTNFVQTLHKYTPRVIATPVLVAACIGVFVVMVISGVDFLAPTADSVLKWGANFGPMTMNGQWWRLVTCMFLHFGIIHLGFNMWVLWDLGKLVERLVGNVGFFVLYFISGIAGSIASLAWNSGVVSAGASGAVFGVAGALLGFICLRRDTVPGSVLKQLRNSMLGFLALNIFLGMSASGIDMAAHVGGLVAGFLCGLILSQPLTEGTPVRRLIRNLILVVVGSAGLYLAVKALPAAPLDVNVEMSHFTEVEQRVINANNDLAEKSQNGSISNEDYATALERDVYQPWVEARGRLEKLMDAPLVNRENLTMLLQYVKAREESWRLRIEGIRENNPDKLDQSNKRWEAAEQLGRRFTAVPAREPGK